MHGIYSSEFLDINLFFFSLFLICMLIQYILFFVLGCACALTWRRVRQATISWREGVAWSALWIAMAVVMWRPEVTSVLARFLGIGRGVDLAFYTAIILLFLLVFQLHIAHDRLERSLTDLVRAQALKHVPEVVQEDEER